MATATVRYAAHRALERLEWVERHVVARQDDRLVRERLVDELDELERFILRIIGAQTGTRRHKPRTRASSATAMSSALPLVVHSLSDTVLCHSRADAVDSPETE
jgi:hypothetical protein